MFAFLFFLDVPFSPQPAVQSTGEIQSGQSNLTTLDQTKDSSLGNMTANNKN